MFPFVNYICQISHMCCKVYSVPKILNNCQIKKKNQLSPIECTLPVHIFGLPTFFTYNHEKIMFHFPLTTAVQYQKIQRDVQMKLACNCHSVFLHLVKMQFIEEMKLRKRGIKQYAFFLTSGILLYLVTQIRNSLSKKKNPVTQQNIFQDMHGSLWCYYAVTG